MANYRLAIGRSGVFPDISAPAGSASFNVQADAVDNADGYLIFLSSSSQLFPDSGLYSYRYKQVGSGALNRNITGIAAGTYYVRIAAYSGTVEGELSYEIVKVAS